MAQQSWENEWLSANKPMHPALLMVFIDNVSGFWVPSTSTWEFRSSLSEIRTWTIAIRGSNSGSDLATNAGESQDREPIVPVEIHFLRQTTRRTRAQICGTDHLRHRHFLFPFLGLWWWNQKAVGRVVHFTLEPYESAWFGNVPEHIRFNPRSSY